MITIKEAKEKGLIYEEYHDKIIEVCPTEIGGCGSALITNEDLTIQKCSNPRCPLKLAGMGKKMLTEFGMNGIGKKYCRKYINRNNMTSHLSILIGKESNYNVTGEILLSAKLMYFLRHLKKNRRNGYYYYDELVRNLCLPNLDKKCYTIFNRFISYEHFEKFLEIRGKSCKEYLMGLDGIDTSTAKNLIETFKLYEPELRMITKIFKPKLPVQKIIEIVMTGPPDYLAFSKKEFLAYANKKGKGVVRVVANGAVYSCDYVVVQKDNSYPDKEIPYPTHSLKYDVAESRQKEKENEFLMSNKVMREEDNILITPKTLINIIEKEVSIYGIQ